MAASTSPAREHSVEVVAILILVGTILGGPGPFAFVLALFLVIAGRTVI
jgi:hypothetical protein